MACLETMYNSEHKSHHHHCHHNHCTPAASPRISFSNDFVDAQQATKKEQSSSRRSKSSAAVSSNFEFSVTNHFMMSADELFSKGKLLPFKDTRRATTTLREELLVDDDDNDEERYQGFPLRPPKGSSSSSSSGWKGFLGLRKSHLVGSKKVDKSEGSSNNDVETRRSGLFSDGARLNANSQELFD